MTPIIYYIRANGKATLRGLLLAFYLSPLTLCAQQYRYSPDIGLSESNFCDTIPIDIEDGQIYIHAHIGERSCRFLLDTGSSQGIVYRNSSFGELQELGNILSRDANNHADTVRVVQLPPFRIGKLTVNAYVASLMPRRAVSQKFDAVIGFDIFNSGLCGKIDARRKTLIITDRKRLFREEEASGYSVRYKLKWFVPYLYVSPFARHTDEALFDTGFNQLYTMNHESLRRHEKDDLTPLSKALGDDIGRQIEGRAAGQVSIGGFGTEHVSEVAFLHLDRLLWGNFPFYDVHAITTEGPSKVGMPILNYGSIIINPFKKAITFLPYEGTEAKVANKPFSIAFVPAVGRPVVGLISDRSEPYKAGMRQGDTIVQIDDRPILSFSDFTQFRFIAGKEHRFRLIDRHGEEKTAVCILKEE